MSEFIPSMGGNSPAIQKTSNGWPLDIIGNIKVPDEVVTVLCVADVDDSLDGTYFKISSRTTNYKVWFNNDSGGNAPDADGDTLVPIAVTTGDTANTIAAAVAAALDALTGISASANTATVTVTIEGDPLAPAEDVDSGVTITITTNGKTALIGTLFGNVVGNVRGNVTGLAFQGAAQVAATSGAVVVPVTNLFSGYTTNATAAIAATLADGLFPGQLKIIKLTTKDTNNLVVTPANFGDGTTLTFDATGEVAVLVWDGADWRVVYTTATVGA